MKAYLTKKTKIEEKVQTGNSTSPTAHKLYKLKERIKGKLRERSKESTKVGKGLNTAKFIKPS